MQVFSDAGVIDSAKFLDYITTQLSSDVATLVKTRDELAKRQGALTAVNEAVADRQAAAKELAAAKEQAKALLDDAKAKNAKSTAKAADLAAQENKLNALEQTKTEAFNALEKDIQNREQILATRESQVAAQANRNDERAAQLNATEAALAARVKAFQDKVAALSA